MPRIEIDGTKLHYQQIGSGTNLLLVHGLFSSIGFWWGPLAFTLAKNHRVTALDLRGHGLSGMTQRGYSANDLAKDILALADHLGLRDIHIVGHSYGGAIALAAALQARDKIIRITLADAWVPALQAQTYTPNLRKWSALKEKLKLKGLQGEGDWPMVAMAFLEEIAEAPEDTLANMQRGQYGRGWMPTKHNSNAIRRWRRLMATTHAWKEFYATSVLTSAALRKLETPVHIIYGKKSGYHQTRDALLKHLPNATNHEVSGGHYFPLLQPRGLTDLIANPPKTAAPSVQFHSRRELADQSMEYDRG
ncbi:alpha/beta fold hydrolase [Ruegeria profundi]|uniref:alpha/beta fold hydrolase n=1 Tax=Ruegeria profundi TaxID=1685378 RepID=UPI001CD62820|nr:alpha/beta hydrolase [Ruegeria profundi]MCA0926787.1 alpha/beta hydrolase [Ruegeria profundi]